MKIAIFLVDAHECSGGVKAAFIMANRFIEKNHSVTIVSVAKKKPKLPFSINSNVKFEYLNSEIGQKRILMNILCKISAMVKASMHFGRKPYDLVFGIGTYPSILLGMVGDDKNQGMIACEHFAYEGVNSIWRYLRCVFYKRLYGVVSLTKRDVKKYRNIINKVFVIPNAVKTSKARSKLENRIILYIGRFTKIKNLEQMLIAYKEFNNKVSGWKLRLVGDGPTKKEIISLAERLNIDKGVEVVPSHIYVRREYLKASMFVLTSKNEGLPMVLLEAQSFGLPIVSFDCETGPSDIIRHGKTGYLVSSGDTKQMARHMLTLAQNKRLRREMGYKAFVDSIQFSHKFILQKWDALIDLYSKERCI